MDILRPPKNFIDTTNLHSILGRFMLSQRDIRRIELLSSSESGITHISKTPK